MKQISTHIPLTKQQAFALVDAVTNNENMAISASAYEIDNDNWVFEATSNEKPNIELYDKLVQEVLGGKLDFKIEPIDVEFDYVSKSLEDLTPVSAGGFYIYGSHDKDDIPDSLININIEAAQAFGTGHHETTTGCLEAINTVLEQENPQNILDVGTGTGVLAIALAKSTGNFIFASDIDPIAVEIANENAKINQVDKNILCFEAAGLNHNTIAENSPYDLIVANILAKPLIEMAHKMSQIVTPEANIILSGILEEQAAKTIAAYEKSGFFLKESLINKQWATLILTKERHS